METQLQTYFTNRIGTSEEIYNAEDWVRITLRLQTAGPVAVSTREQIVPVLSGLGILLPIDDFITFILPAGSRLFIAAEATNRVAVQIEPVPWLQQILHAMDQGFGATIRALFRLKNPAAAPRPPTTREVSPVQCPDGARNWKGGA